MSATHHTYNTHVKTKSLPSVIVAPVSGKEQSGGGGVEQVVRTVIEDI